MMGGSFGFMGVFMWIIWIAVFVGLFLFVKWVIQQSRPAKEKYDEDSLEILKRRYVCGEIDKREFEQKKKDIFS